MNNIPSIGEQTELGYKLLESANPSMAEYSSNEDALNAYRNSLRVGLCFGADHTLSLITTAVNRHKEYAQKFVTTNAIDHTIKNSVIRYFRSIDEKNIYMTGVEDTRRMHEVIDPDVINFLEDYVGHY